MQLKEISLTELSELIETIVRKVVTETNRPAVGSKDIYTRNEAAALLGVTLTTLYVWDKNGILPAQRLGKKVFYKTSTIDNFFTTRPQMQNKSKGY